MQGPKLAARTPDLASETNRPLSYVRPDDHLDPGLCQGSGRRPWSASRSLWSRSLHWASKRWSGGLRVVRWPAGFGTDVLVGNVVFV